MENTVEEIEHANEVALKATSGLWLFEGDFSDEDGEFSDSADDLGELPDVTMADLEFYDMPWMSSPISSSNLPSSSPLRG
jgi:hypothetical protein